MAGINILSNEILIEILDHFESDAQRSVPIDRRDHLSVESFRPPSPPPSSQAQDIGSFRLTCRRFSELGAAYQFSRLSLRFSTSGFRRLDRISGVPRLAKHVKRFSYLVPPFYNQSQQVDGRRPGSTGSTPSDWTLTIRSKEQKKILNAGEDIRVLKKAMAAFTSLQHVQLLRLIEPTATAEPSFVDNQWSIACAHAIRTMSEALQFANSPFSRFSGPMIHPHSALAVQGKIPQIVLAHASRLTCLELHFDSGLDLHSNVMKLFDTCFVNVFQAAKNLQVLHIGFPSRTPMDLRLEQIFRHTHWQRLRAFGVQAWRLDADEIISLARRHRKTLKGLRLRDVQLKPGGRWKDVLSMLRTEMEDLDWVSLRRIDYAAHFDEVWSGSVEVPDDPPGGGSDSDDEDDLLSHVSGQESEPSSSGEDSEDESNPNTDDYGPDADELALLPNTPASLPFCTCNEDPHPSSADDLGDNGDFVTYRQRKMWEKWVVKRCPEHNHT